MEDSNDGLNDAIEFFAFSLIMPDYDEHGNETGCSSCLSVIIGIFVIAFMFYSCIASFVE